MIQMLEEIKEKGKANEDYIEPPDLNINTFDWVSITMLVDEKNK